MPNVWATFLENLVPRSCVANSGHTDTDGRGGDRRCDVGVCGDVEQPLLVNQKSRV